jgi:hypothetical protein
MPGFTSGVQYCQTTDNLTTSGTAIEGPCVFHGAWFCLDEDEDIVVNIYDNTAASGKRLIPINPTDGGFKILGAVRSYSILAPKPVFAENGIHVDVSGSNYGYQVLYEQ